MKGKKLEAIPYNISSMLFFSHRSLEKEPQKDSSKLIGKGYENSARIEKTVKNKRLKGSKRMCIEGSRRKPFDEKLDKSVLQ